MSKYQGGCACGAIRYEVGAEPKFLFHCQYRQCQRITGSGHASQFMVPKDAVAIRERLTYHELSADSGNAVSSGFCTTCGNPIMKKARAVSRRCSCMRRAWMIPACSSRKRLSGMPADNRGIMSIPVWKRLKDLMSVGFSPHHPRFQLVQ